MCNVGFVVTDRLEEALNHHRQALSLRHERQKILAANIANADTPGFKARDIDFRAEFASALGRRGERLELAATAPGHLARRGAPAAVGEVLYRVPDQPSLDGNTVDIDRERSAFVDNSVRYQAALTLLNQRIQGLKGAMAPE
nr:flagellar basal body rod protein FlgB [Thauera aromatica]